MADNQHDDPLVDTSITESDPEAECTYDSGVYLSPETLLKNRHDMKEINHAKQIATRKGLKMELAILETKSASNVSWGGGGGKK